MDCQEPKDSMAGILVSPGVNAKILERKAVWKARRGDAKFKDILRQRCRRRIKERRDQIISQCRGLDAPDVKQPLSDIVREEYNRFVKQLESGYIEEEWDEVNWETPREILSDQEEWLMNQCEGMLDNEALSDMLEEVNELVCPICLKGALREWTLEKTIKCDNCAMRVSACNSLSQVQSQISRCLNTHSESECSSNVNFFVAKEEEMQSLYVMCSDCGYLDIVG